MIPYNRLELLFFRCGRSFVLNSVALLVSFMQLGSSFHVLNVFIKNCLIESRNLCRMQIIFFVLVDLENCNFSNNYDGSLVYITLCKKIIVQLFI